MDYEHDFLNRIREFLDSKLANIDATKDEELEEYDIIQKMIIEVQSYREIGEFTVTGFCDGFNRFLDRFDKSKVVDEVRKFMEIEQLKEKYARDIDGEMDEVSKEKLEWLKNIGAVDISKFNYMILSNGHLYSLEYLKGKSLEELKAEYQTLYDNMKGGEQ